MLFDFSGVDVEVVANGQLPNTANGDKQKQADDRAAMETKSKDKLREMFPEKPNMAIASGCDKPADVRIQTNPVIAAQKEAERKRQETVAASEDDDDLPGVSVDVLLANNAMLTDVLVGELPAAEAAEAAASEVASESQATESTPPAEPAKSEPVEHIFYRPETSIERLARREHETEIQEAQAKLSDLVLRQREIEAELKAAKKEVKEAAAELEELQKRDPVARPLFENVEMLSTQATPPRNSSVDPQAKTPGKSEADANSEPSDGPQSTAWESAKIEALKLGKTLTEKLADAGIETIGQLENFRREISLGRKDWPRGIGEAKVTRITDSIIDWLNKNRDAFAAKPVNESETGATTLAEAAVETATESLAEEPAAEVAESPEVAAADAGDAPATQGKYPARVRLLVDIADDNMFHGGAVKGSVHDVAEYLPENDAVYVADAKGELCGLVKEHNEYEVIAWSDICPKPNAEDDSDL